MKTNILLFSLFITSFFAFSQEKYNPFEGIGKTTEVVTLSNGKYKEIYGGDTLKRIGTVIFDTKNNKVVQFLAEDDTTTLVKKEGDFVTRWLSIDPLAAKYPSLCPYNFVNNSPIIFIDPDGKEPILPLIGTMTSLIQLMRDNNIKNISEAIVFFGDSKTSLPKKMDKYSENQLSTSKTKANNSSRYLYTKKAGWLDMKHFFSAANEIEEGTSIESVLIKGELLEYRQDLQKKPSAWSYEDLQSNLQGAHFGLQFKGLEGEEFYKALEVFFKDLSIGTIDDAPNKNDIPFSERIYGQVPTNKSYKPIFTNFEYPVIKTNENTGSEITPSDNTQYQFEYNIKID